MEFTNKNIKPTLSTPTKMGKQLDTNFKKEIRKSGMNLKENGMMIQEKEQSLKKKIFKLDKMETLVHTDENLSKIFNEMKQDAAEKFGYHWNETILNMIFNDYVLNSPKNLQKYKNTRAKPKKRRGEEGIKELQNDIDKEKEASSNAAARTADLMGGSANGDDKEKVDELFGFGSKGLGTELPMNKRSKNDTYFVDLAKKKLVAPVPYNSTPEEKQAIVQKYVGQPNIKQISWYNAVKQGIQGVPSEVPDGSIEQMDAEVAKKYPQGTASMVSLAEYGEDSGGQDMTWGMYNRTPERKHGMDKSVLKASAWGVAQALEPLLPQDYLEKDVESAVETYWTENGLDFHRLQKEDFWEDLYYNLSDLRKAAGKPQSKFLGHSHNMEETIEVDGEMSPETYRLQVIYALKKLNPGVKLMNHILTSKPESEEYNFILRNFQNRISPDKTAQSIRDSWYGVSETTGAASAGAFSAPMGYSKKQVTETTTSASSGQYSGPRIWAKNPETSRFAHKPAWKGGEIVSESVINGDKDYLTEAKAFRVYLLKNEIIDMLNESFEIGEADSFQQHSQKMLNKLHQYSQEHPELGNDPDFQDLLKITGERAGKQPEPQHTGTIPTQTNVSEHHLDSREDKIAYIMQNGGTEDLSMKSDEEINSIYLNAEKANGVGVNNYKEALAQDIHNTSGGADNASEPTSELEANDGLFKGRWNENITEKIEEGFFSNDSNSDLNIDQIKSIIDNFNQSPESTDLRNQFVKAKDYVKAKAGNIVRMPQLKMWLDQNMPVLSTYVGTLWGNWELTPKLNENTNSMKINENQYKDYLKKRLTENVKSLKTLNETQKKDFLKKIHEDYMKESMIDDQPDSMINNQETSIVKSMDSDELNKDGAPMVAASSIGGVQQEGYDSDDLNAKPSIADKMADYSEEEPESNDSVVEPVAKVTDTKEKQYQQGGDDPQVANDAEQFRQMLKTKFGVESVSELSPIQRQQLMKTMNFGSPTTPEKSPIDMDFKQFTPSDSEKAEYLGRDEKRLNFLAQNSNRVNDVSGYMTLAKEFKDQTGENMFHPMAILASIEQMPKDSLMRSRLGNVESVLRSQMSKKIAESLNEDRKPSSILNIEKLGSENAKNFKVDSAKEDALDQSKTYPKPQPADSIQKAAVYPNPKNFYIEQDVEKVNREAKSMADIEKEVLAKTKGEAFNNVGNSTNDKGNEIPKRNLTKEEAYELAMNRGDGMHNIVYDNKPSERFEKRMETDMGKEVYKNREDKMDYRADMPMYNKDTQPTANGDKKEENNKFKMGYNNESVSAKYRDEFGKLQLVEFAMKNVVEVTSVADDAIKLNVDGMGNKYSLAGKKINENAGFNDFVEKYAFYMTENKVVAIEKTKVIVETKIAVKGKVNESFDKMKHLMNYKPSSYVDTKKSVKF
jgi:hypothetical protein